MSATELKVGDTIWFVPSRGTAYEETITKIGRRWATLGNGWRPYRIDINTFWAEMGATMLRPDEPTVRVRPTSTLKPWKTLGAT